MRKEVNLYQEKPQTFCEGARERKSHVGCADLLDESGRVQAVAWCFVKEARLRMLDSD
jgi:hypothetical protein